MMHSGFEAGMIQEALTSPRMFGALAKGFLFKGKAQEQHGDDDASDNHSSGEVIPLVLNQSHGEEAAVAVGERESKL